MAKTAKYSCKFNDDWLKQQEFKPWMAQSKDVKSAFCNFWHQSFLYLKYEYKCSQESWSGRKASRLNEFEKFKFHITLHNAQLFSGGHLYCITFVVFEYLNMALVMENKICRYCNAVLSYKTRSSNESLALILFFCGHTS